MPHAETDVLRSLLDAVLDGETDPGERRSVPKTATAGNVSAGHLFRVVPRVAVASPAAMRRQAARPMLADAGS